MSTKGFITIATGRDEYYILARNLLRTYRFFTKNRLPFSILADRVNEYTNEFDNVILFEEPAANSYLDKLKMGNYLPYDLNIFIDSDCLAFGDLNKLFDYFECADDFSCFGRVLPLDDNTGWFEYEYLGDYQKYVDYIVGLHGGIYFMRKGEITSNVFTSAIKFIPEYSKFHFKGKFDNPGDEPLIALSMAINHCKPVPFQINAICCYWEYVDDMTIDITKPIALINSKPKEQTILMHWGTRYTRELEYKKQMALFDLIQNGHATEKQIQKINKEYARLMLVEKIHRFRNRLINKIQRMIGLK